MTVNTKIEWCDSTINFCGGHGMKCFLRILASQIGFVVGFGVFPLGAWLYGYDFPTQRGEYAMQYYAVVLISLFIGISLAIAGWQLVEEAFSE